MPGDHVFISYAQRDGPFVNLLTKNFRRLKLDTWRDIEKLKPGEDWQQRIDDGLRAAGAVVVVLSRQAIKSQYVAYEWAFAIGAEIPIVPIMIDRLSIAQIHPRLADIEIADFTKSKKPWLRLVDALNSQSPTRQNSPELRAAFEIEGRKPNKVADEYVILLSVDRAPKNTTRVVYEIHDKSFKERRWSEKNRQKGFSSWMQTYGDVLLSARIETSGGATSIEETLYSALCRTYANDKSVAITKALRNIERY